MWRQPPRPWTENTPEKLLLRREAMAVLEEAIAELPPNQRAVVTLRDVDGLDSGEVCDLLEISESNQRVLLHRGRTKLRRALARYLTGE
jgi:RNA polymerase sigma-70 factor (ECF subfamily)